MSTAIAINHQKIALKTCNGKAVVTFSDIDAVHQRPEGTARKRFNDNKAHFVIEEDYFVRKTDEAKKEYGITAPNGLTLITESGYLMLCKSFTDELSWRVQRQLVDCYFHRKDDDEPYEYFDKTFHGVPVMTTRDFEFFTGVSKGTVNPFLRNHGKPGTDYMKVSTFEDRLQLRKENPRLRQISGALNLITRTGVELLCDAFGIQFDPPEGLTVAEPQRDPADEEFEALKKTEKYILILSDMLEQYKNGQDATERAVYKKLMYMTVCDLMTLISYLSGNAGQIDIDEKNRKFYHMLDNEDKHYIFGLMKTLITAVKYHS